MSDARWSDIDEKGLAEWRATRPESVQKLIDDYPPHLLYTLGDRRRCTLHSYSEDGTVTVNITQEWNPECELWLMNRQVFGIDPKDLKRVPQGEWSLVSKVQP